MNECVWIQSDRYVTKDLLDTTDLLMMFIYDVIIQLCT